MKKDKKNKYTSLKQKLTKETSPEKK